MNEWEELFDFRDNYFFYFFCCMLTIHAGIWTQRTMFHTIIKVVSTVIVIIHKIININVCINICCNSSKILTKYINNNLLVLSILTVNIQ